jgi:hypothetical protein
MSDSKPRAVVKKKHKRDNNDMHEASMYPTSLIFPQTMDAKVARRKVLRWTKDSLETVSRGKWMAQYFMYKMERDRVHEKLKKFEYAKVKCVLEKVDREYIKHELLNHIDATNLGYPENAKKQVANFRILHNEVRRMNEAGTPFLHNWLNALVDGVFHRKTLYEAYYFQTVMKSKPHKWVNCDFHSDLEDCPAEWDFGKLGDKAPISLYFPVGENSVKIEIEHTVKTVGRPRQKMTTILELEQGDVLLFNTTACRHRTAKPDKIKEVPDRVNILMSGFSEFLELDPPEGEIYEELKWKKKK